MVTPKGPRFMFWVGLGFLAIAIVALVVGLVADGDVAAGQFGVATGFALVGGALLVLGRRTPATTHD